MISKELNNIKTKLLDLLDQNEWAEDEMAKLDRDEFVIDISAKERIMNWG